MKYVPQLHQVNPCNSPDEVHLVWGWQHVNKIKLAFGPPCTFLAPLRAVIHCLDSQYTLLQANLLTLFSSVNGDVPIQLKNCILADLTLACDKLAGSLQPRADADVGDRLLGLGVLQAR